MPEHAQSPLTADLFRLTPSHARADVADRHHWGFYDVEPDASEHGVWVTQRALIPLAPSAHGPVKLTGLYFPDLIAKQTGRRESTLRFLIAGDESHCATLSSRGEFQIEFMLERIPGTPAHLVIECAAYFVPSLIGVGADSRRLCWRLKRLMVGDRAVFDCESNFNFLFETAIHQAGHELNENRSAHGKRAALVQFHLDTPTTGPSDELADSFVVSGWACNLAAHAPARTRIIFDHDVHSAKAVARQDVQAALAVVCPLPVDTGFSALIRPAIGVHLMRIEAEVSSGKWAVQAIALVFSKPGKRQGDQASIATWRMLTSPPALLFHTLNHLRGGPVVPAESGSLTNLRFHVDSPHMQSVNIVTKTYVVSGWALDEDARTSLAVRVIVGDVVHNTHAKPREDVQRVFHTGKKLPLDTGFACVLSLPIGLHRMRVETQIADSSWVVIRRALLVRIPAVGAENRPPPKLSYRAWTRLHSKRLLHEFAEIDRHVEVMLVKPLFTVLIDVRLRTKGLAATVQSIRDQRYRHHEIRLVSVAAGKVGARLCEKTGVSLATSLPADENHFIVVLQSGDRLAPDALYEFASAINHAPDTDLVYGDEDYETDGGTGIKPFFKPGWSPDYLETFNYLGFTACFRATVGRECLANLASVHAYDFVLRFTERTHKIVHVSKMLGHSAKVPENQPAEDMAALNGRLHRTNRSGTISEHAEQKGCYAIALNLNEDALVSIVIPTAGKTVNVEGRMIDLLENVVKQIQERSTYQRFEIVIVDNGDLSETQIRMLNARNCKRITYTNVVFNIAKKLNLGVSIATGKFLLLMNDDIEILTPAWIERMLEHFEKPHVGVVGGKLLYPDGKTQHVGVVHNSGNPDHVRRLFPRHDAGYFFSTCGVRNFSAVTGACMMTPATVYRRVGGYSEELAVSYNDADYCMKVRQQGLSVVYAPAMELIHMESQSRVASADMTEVAWYQLRWAAEVVEDEFYNERFLTVASPTFVPHVNERLL